MSWTKRLRGVLQARKLDSDLDEELSAHIEMRTRDNMASGMTEQEARYDARRRFGNTTLMKEDTRAMDILGWIEALAQDLRYGARMLRRSPGFTAVAILTLALGIGANIATFTVVRAVLLNPLPFPHPEQLVRVYDDLRGSNTKDAGMSVPELWDLRDKAGIFQSVTALMSADTNLTGGDHPERAELLGASASYFTMLGVSPQLGRIFTEQEAQPGFTDGVLISDAFWHRMFGAAPEVIGRKIRLDNDLYTVIGVLPPGFRHPGRSLTNDVDVFSAAGFSAAPFPAPPLRSVRYLPGAMGRLKAGLTLGQAQERLNALTEELRREYPSDYPAGSGWALRLVPLQEDLVGNKRTELLVLLGAVAFVLLIACVNLANLLLARSARRQREIAVRLALGAGRGRLIRQFLTESILLGSVSGGVALLTVMWFGQWLWKLAPAGLPRLNEVSVNGGVLLFALVVSILTGVMFGLAPALQTVRRNPVAELREGGRGAGSSKHQIKVSRVLVTCEIALSLVLLIGAGLLLRSFSHLLDVQPGFEPHHLVTARIWLAFPNDPAEDPYRTTEAREAFMHEVLRRVRGLGGVEEAALGSGNGVPMEARPNRVPFSMDEQSADPKNVPEAEISAVTPEYFRVLKIPLLRGRAFTEADNSRGQPVVIINETLAKRYWGDEDPVGRQIQLDPGHAKSDAENPLRTIIGVAGDIKSNGFDAASPPYMYFPTYQRPPYTGVVYLRTATAPGILADTIRREVQSLDPSIPVFAVRSMDEVIAKYLADRRFALELLGVFAAVALMLASIGIYGVMAYTFSQRTNEIGIRMVMGARRSDILSIAVGEGALLVAVGVVSGLAGSAVLTRFLGSMLFGVQPTDPITYAAIAALLTVVTLLACLLPARRATRVDPLIALRHE
jgi:putative ABC transport system permease protein